MTSIPSLEPCLKYCTFRPHIALYISFDPSVLFFYIALDYFFSLLACGQ